MFTKLVCHRVFAISPVNISGGGTFNDVFEFDFGHVIHHVTTEDYRTAVNVCEPSARLGARRPRT